MTVALMAPEPEPISSVEREAKAAEAKERAKIVRDNLERMREGQRRKEMEDREAKQAEEFQI